MRDISAAAAGFGKSASSGEQIQGVAPRKQTSHILGGYNVRKKKILISFKDSFGILGYSTEKAQSQEEKKFNRCTSANVPKTAIAKC